MDEIQGIYFLGYSFKILFDSKFFFFYFILILNLSQLREITRG